jgi:hypothetical protein
MSRTLTYRPTDTDGTESGGFIVVNVDARRRNPCQVIVDEKGDAYFPTLEAAREFCKRARREGRNAEIYVYALVGVPAALEILPDHFTLR